MPFDIIVLADAGVSGLGCAVQSATAAKADAPLSSAVVLADRCRRDLRTLDEPDTLRFLLVASAPGKRRW